MVESAVIGLGESDDELAFSLKDTEGVDSVFGQHRGMNDGRLVAKVFGTIPEIRNKAGADDVFKFGGL